MKVKIERINAELKRCIANIIAQDIKDPRLGSALVGVTKVYVTPDLKYAKVYISVFAQSAEEVKAAFDTVVRSKAFIRSRLKDAVNVRLVPELNFILDDSVDYSMKIDAILSEIHKAEESGENHD